MGLETIYTLYIFTAKLATLRAYRLKRCGPRCLMFFLLLFRLFLVVSLEAGFLLFSLFSGPTSNYQIPLPWRQLQDKTPRATFTSIVVNHC